MSFTNTHLSFSRLSRFEQCPLSFKFHYVDKSEAEPGVPVRFGKAIHAVLERLLRDVVNAERDTALSEEDAFGLFRQAWEAAKLSGFDLFEQGLGILRDFVREQGVVQHRDVLAIEREFRLPVGPFTVLGFIDRVDWVNDDTIEIIDYKTNHQLFTREEVDESLQMSLYQAAAQRIWPWVKNVQLTFWMVRHSVRQRTTRTPQQVADALAYMEMLGRQTESVTEYPARLNTNCSYCDHRQQCPAYAEALKARREFICEDPSNLEAVAREREEVARLAKVLYARKDELEGILKGHLRDREELILNGVRYRMYNTTSVDYPVEPTLGLLANATGRTRDELVAELASIDKKALDALLKRLGKELDKSRLTLLRAELDARAEKRHSPRFWAKEVA